MSTALYLISTEQVATPDPWTTPSDFSGIADITPNSWVSGGLQAAISQWSTSGNFGFVFMINGSGQLRLYVSGNGTTNTFKTTGQVAATVAGLSAGERGQIGFTYDADNGSSQSVWKFFVRPDGGSWSLLDGAAQTGSVLTPFNSAANVMIGGYGSGSGSNGMTGKFHGVELYSGIGANTEPGQGTLVAAPNFSLPVEPRSRDSLGNIWTINGSAYAWEGV